MTPGDGGPAPTDGSRPSRPQDATLVTVDDQAAAAAPLLKPGVQIGRYQILHKLGSGGMGVVYAAYDPDLDRKVAVKFLLSGADGTDVSRPAHQRLVREAQAMAKLDHPNVVSVFDVGELDDRIWVAMAFVRGATLSEWMADKARDWREVLRVFSGAGRGLAAAHRAGIIHRDFKPDNVMLSEEGRPLVMDFGLARGSSGADTDEPPNSELPHDTLGADSQGVLDTPLTRAGSVLGTPAYMAPEQHLGLELDPRSDQFSFCVALYEALYGERPFHARTQAALAFEVTEGNVREAPQGHRVPAWIRRVVLRGLSTRPEERWPDLTALLAALADDPSIRRNRRIGFASAAGFLGLLVWLGAGEPSAQDQCQRELQALERVWNDERESQLAAAFEASGVPIAGEVWARVKDRIELQAGVWRSERLALCEAPSPEIASGPLRLRAEACFEQRVSEVDALLSALESVDAPVVAKAVEATNGLSAVSDCQAPERLRQRPDEPTDPQLRRSAQALRQSITKIEALRSSGQIQKARELAESIAPEVEASNFDPLRVEFQLEEGFVLVSDGKPKEAVERAREAYTLAVRSGYDAKAVPAAVLLAQETVDEDVEQAELWTELALATTQRIASPPLVVARVAHAQAQIAKHKSRYEEMLGHRMRAFEIMKERFGERHTRTTDAMNNVGSAHYWLKDRAQARQWYERALAINEEILGPNHPSLALVLNNLAAARAGSDQADTIMDLRRRALDIRLKVFGENSLETASSLLAIGNGERARGRLDEAIEYYKRSVAAVEAVYGRPHLDQAMALNNLGTVYFKRGEYPESVKYYEQSLVLNDAAYQGEHIEVARNLKNLAHARIEAGEGDQSGKELARSYTIALKLWGPDRPALGTIVWLQGEAAMLRGDLEAAEGFFEESLRLAPDPEGKDPEALQTRMGLATILSPRGGKDRKRAEELMRFSLKAWTKMDSPLATKKAAQCEAFLKGRG